VTRTPPLSDQNRFSILTVYVDSTVPFRIVRQSRVTEPPDGAEIGWLSRVMLALAGRDMGLPQKKKNWHAKIFKHAEIPHMSRVPLASAGAKFQRSGHGSQAMPNNSKWYSIPEIDEPVDTPKVVQTPETPSVKPAISRPNWEKRLPKHFVIGALDETEGSRRSLTLKVELQTTDTGITMSVRALLDSGATGMFIDREYVKTNRLSTRTLSHPIPVRNIDRTFNEAGSVHEVVELLLKYKNHSEKAFFTVTSLGRQNMIMGHSWLRKHNPDIDWTTGDVKMTRCNGGCCSGCRDEACEERKARKNEARHISDCSIGDLPGANPR
jgi:hypothetical protein